MCLLQPPGYPKRDKREPLLYWVDVQADPSLCRSHRSYCRFCCALAQILSGYLLLFGVMNGICERLSCIMSKCSFWPVLSEEINVSTFSSLQSDQRLCFTLNNQGSVVSSCRQLWLIRPCRCTDWSDSPFGMYVWRNIFSLWLNYL